jgi:hypothetical protein
MAKPNKESIITEKVDKTFEKHKLVIDTYIKNGLNGTLAYMSIYPDSQYASADASFRNVLEIPRVKEYFNFELEKVKNQLDLQKTDLIKLLKGWIYSDITETMELTTAQLKELPKEVRQLVTSYKRTKRTLNGSGGDVLEDSIELKFVSKERAVEILTKILGLNAPKEVDVNINKGFYLELDKDGE